MEKYEVHKKNTRTKMTQERKRLTRKKGRETGVIK